MDLRCVCPNARQLLDARPLTESWSSEPLAGRDIVRAEACAADSYWRVVAVALVIGYIC